MIYTIYLIYTVVLDYYSKSWSYTYTCSSSGTVTGTLGGTSTYTLTCTSSCISTGTSVGNVLFETDQFIIGFTNIPSSCILL